MRTALTIAGSDSGGGAGIQADLKTFAALGVYGLTALTAVTAQNSLGVSAVAPLPPDLIVAQIDAVVSDFGADAVKIGMLGHADAARAVATAIRRLRLSPVVLDPVMVAKGGHALIDDDAIDVLVGELMPLAAVITPNALEAERLTGLRVATLDDARAAAAHLVKMGARAAIVKGGHLAGPPIDVLADGAATVELRADRIDTPHTHGTGCTFSAALAAHLARGASLADAARDAKAYVTIAIARAPGLGHGHGPLGH